MSTREAQEGRACFKNSIAWESVRRQEEVTSALRRLQDPEIERRDAAFQYLTGAARRLGNAQFWSDLAQYTESPRTLSNRSLDLFFEHCPKVIVGELDRQALMDFMANLPGFMLYPTRNRSINLDSMEE
ncbi:MAG: hypothetical protein QG621_375 [Patescibacteria group bacterium]|nr:hypothetical protein [Patescibacteria group bacterium]